jgi:hypothetical protein
MPPVPGVPVATRGCGAEYLRLVNMARTTLQVLNNRISLVKGKDKNNFETHFVSIRNKAFLRESVGQ